MYCKGRLGQSRPRRPGCALQLPEEGKRAGGGRGAQAWHGEMLLHPQGGQALGQASGRAQVPEGHRTVPSFPAQSKGKTFAGGEQGNWKDSAVQQPVSC